MKDFMSVDLGVLGLIGTVVSLLLAAYFYYRPRFRSQLVYQTRGVRLIGEHGALPAEATVTYAGAPVRGLTTSMVMLWNKGNATLDGSNIATNDGLRLEFDENATILKVEVLKVSRDSIGFEVGDGASGSVRLSFDFLDPKDGAVIRVLHTGLNVHARVLGTIKGSKKGCVDLGVLELPSKAPEPKSWLGRLHQSINYGATTFGLIAIAAVVFAVGGLIPELLLWIFPDWGQPSPPVLTPGKIAWPQVVFGIIVALASWFIHSELRRRYPPSLVPEDSGT